MNWVSSWTKKFNLTQLKSPITSHEPMIFLPILRTLIIATWVAYALPLFAQSDADRAAVRHYRVDVGDLLKIRVFGEEDLTLDARVRSDGLISYPFLGELRIAGLNTSEIERLITDGLKGDYLIDPKVNITVVQYRLFYINGEVETPGAYEYRPGLTVHRAISIAGGFTERAARSKIYLTPEKDASAEPVRVQLDHTVGPGDIVTVKESFF